MVYIQMNIMVVTPTPQISQNLILCAILGCQATQKKLQLLVCWEYNLPGTVPLYSK